MLIGCKSLHQHVADMDWVVFDCRHDIADHTLGAKAYRAQHIPNAYFASVENDLAGPPTRLCGGRHPLPDPEKFAEFLAAHGVTPRTWIVAYDDGSTQYAARLWWLARWIGHTHVAVLDGGYASWTGGGYMTTSEPTEPLPRGRVTPRVDWSLMVTVDELQQEMADGRCVVLDARLGARFRGEREPIDPVAGRIPGARNRFYKDNLTPDLAMRPLGELRREFIQLVGDRPPGRVVHQCGSGVTACVNLLTMEHIGLKGSRLYAGSWSEWISDSRRPVARG